MPAPTPPFRTRALLRLARSHALLIAAGLLACLMVREAVLQSVEEAYLEETAWRVVNDAHALTARDRVIALRDYVRANVDFRGAPGEDDGRPFLRATAADTLQTGLGFCGEDSRAFIGLARAVGIEAQRVNLYGSLNHVVAEVELVPHQRLVVDAQRRPQIVDLEPLDEVILRPEFDDYYTLNLRRLHLGWLVSRVRFEMGALTYWTENPHALTAALWGLLALGLLFLRVARVALRVFLHRRGWVHRSALPPHRAPEPAAPALLPGHPGGPPATDQTAGPWAA